MSFRDYMLPSSNFVLDVPVKESILTNTQKSKNTPLQSDGQLSFVGW
jgi:hypothetical protein